MQVDIQVIDHGAQRYDTCGDWWWEVDTLHIRVSKLNNWKEEMCIAYHELYEALVCRSEGISEQSVTDFDVRFEELRKLHPKLLGDHEPGDMVTAPYHEPHKSASSMERMLAVGLKVDWPTYVKKVDSL